MKRLSLLFLLAGCGSLWTAQSHTYLRDIGPAGGLVVSEDGRFSLEIPPGALDHVVTVEVEPQPSDDPHVIGPLYKVTPLGLGLKVGGTLHLATDSMPVYKDRPSLGKVLPDGSWKPIKGSSWDAKNGGIVDDTIASLEVFAAWVYCENTDDCSPTTGTVCLKPDGLVPSKAQHTCGRECTGTSTAGCPEGQICDGASCVQICVPACTQSADCGPAMVCDASSCAVCVPNTGCTDADGDGYYAEAGCNTMVDCDDHNADVHPGATEICNNVDDDCDGTVDDGNASASCPPGESCWPGGQCF